MSAQCVVQGAAFGRPFRYGVGYVRGPKICNLKALELLHGQKVSRCRRALDATQINFGRPLLSESRKDYTDG